MKNNHIKTFLWIIFGAGVGIGLYAYKKNKKKRAEDDLKQTIARINRSKDLNDDVQEERKYFSLNRKDSSSDCFEDKLNALDKVIEEDASKTIEECFDKDVDLCVNPSLVEEDVQNNVSEFEEIVSGTKNQEDDEIKELIFSDKVDSEEENFYANDISNVLAEVFDDNKETKDVTFFETNDEEPLVETKKKFPMLGLLDYYMIRNEFVTNGMMSNELVEVLERLYEKKLITSKHSECRYLSTKLANDFEEILDNLLAIDELREHIESITSDTIEDVRNDKTYVDDAWVSDRGDVAIVPTTQGISVSELSENEKLVYLFICKCFISIFLETREKTLREMDEIVQQSQNVLLEKEVETISCEEKMVSPVVEEFVQDVAQDVVTAQEQNILVENFENVENEECVKEKSERDLLLEELESIQQRKEILEKNKKQGYLSTRDFVELSNELAIAENKIKTQLEQ